MKKPLIPEDKINTEEGWSAMRFQSLSNRYFLML